MKSFLGFPLHSMISAVAPPMSSSQGCLSVPPLREKSCQQPHGISCSTTKTVSVTIKASLIAPYTSRELRNPPIIDQCKVTFTSSIPTFGATLHCCGDPFLAQRPVGEDIRNIRLHQMGAMVARTGLTKRGEKEQTFNSQL